ncbi:PEP-CTERM sorting domain-containing protein [Aquabacterium sp. CECT 9606]|uniref:PEP-CTERM sorting domain-containing protein n=1 Tax=Aquabacterium sp. CECT 9606 TaxID=2845822 RepID=UPI001E5EE516|nr:PEP-CTERM sorting domain-containing protein [Aquabacterium sp. CECT 9606]CAH0349326.1 hypothetical protein AQB9606_01015 [Aquabacterium sp. CECT 9606]
MKKMIQGVATATFLLASTGSALAATFTPSFADYAFPGTQFTVDAPANTYFNAHYGITISNAYLYKDSRDTFDGIGIANGTVAEIGSPQTGRIDFSEKTDYVTFDYLAIQSTTYHAYATDNTEVASFAAAPGTGTQTLTAGSKLIAYLTFESTGGYGTVSSLTYNFDGKTDGVNNGIPTVPEPETYALLLAGLATAGMLVRRRKA